jgi:hypothetical protein
VAAQGSDPQPQNSARGVWADLGGNRSSHPRRQAAMPGALHAWQPLASVASARGGSAREGKARRHLPPGPSGDDGARAHQSGTETAERPDRGIGRTEVQADRRLLQVTDLRDFGFSAGLQNSGNCASASGASLRRGMGRIDSGRVPNLRASAGRLDNRIWPNHRWCNRFILRSKSAIWS